VANEFGTGVGLWAKVIKQAIGAPRSVPQTTASLIDWTGDIGLVAEQAKMAQKIASDHGGTHFAWAMTPEDRSKLWQARHDAYFAWKAAWPGTECWSTDVCVPISRLAECIIETQKDIAISSLPAGIVGHAGDGNFHVAFMLNRNEPKEMAEAERLNQRLVRRALSLDGTCTGEHGIGCGKIDFLIAEHGDAISVMHAIKKALDPDNIMNPGKILGPK
jgi:D-lactate dehydrogenase (cytochrome)